MVSGMLIETARQTTVPDAAAPSMPRANGFAGVLAGVAGAEAQIPAPMAAAAPTPPIAFVSLAEPAAPGAGGIADGPAPSNMRLAADARPAAGELAALVAPPLRSRPAAAPPGAVAPARKAGSLAGADADGTCGLVPQPAGGAAAVRPPDAAPGQGAVAAVQMDDPATPDISASVQAAGQTAPSAAEAAAGPIVGGRQEKQTDRPGTASIPALPDQEVASALPAVAPSSPQTTASRSAAPPQPDQLAAVAAKGPQAGAETAKPARGRVGLAVAAGADPASGLRARQTDAAHWSAIETQVQPAMVASTTGAASPPPNPEAALQPTPGAAITPANQAAHVRDTLPTPAADGLAAGDRSPILQAAGAVQFLARNKDGDQTLVLRLDPEELGRLQISIRQSRENPASIAIRVERPETLLLLMRDQGQLHRALDSAGVTPEGRQLSFQLAPAAADAPTQHGALHTGSSQAGPGQGGSQESWGHGGRGNHRGAASPGRDSSVEWNVVAIAEPAPGQRAGAMRRGVDITA